MAQQENNLPVFQFKNVIKHQPLTPGNNIAILENINIEITRGNIITITGPSGAGKSTLLFLLNRLIDTDQGEIFYQGKKLVDWDVTELRRQVGLVFQHPTMLAGSVKDNLLYGPLLHNEYPVESPAQLIEQVELPSYLLERDARDLSGGQQQRVTLARTLANSPRVLLLDEITSSLDPKTSSSIEKLVISLNNEQGYTCLWVTHNNDQSRRVGNTTWYLNNGKIEVI
ncbi:MAG: phosphate ABC transporter ATP-binding protein [Clostridiales bacterium]|nr:phosphate ABC transporter ATP-binding protein [Clostridiales bacterium]MCF8023656.1 phosphate ABC transporter ATP-binding protein [Clostridiales bacterium]